MKGTVICEGLALWRVRSGALALNRQQRSTAAKLLSLLEKWKEWQSLHAVYEQMHILAFRCLWEKHLIWRKRKGTVMRILNENWHHTVGLWRKTEIVEGGEEKLYNQTLPHLHHPVACRPHCLPPCVWKTKIELKCLLLNMSGETPGNGLNFNQRHMTQRILANQLTSPQLIKNSPFMARSSDSSANTGHESANLSIQNS